MAITQTGSHRARLESFTWEKPGVASAVYSQITKIGVNGTAPGPSSLYGVPMSYQGKSVRNMGSHWETKFFYKGAKDIPRSPTDPETGNPAERWSMDISLNTCPISQHPDIDSLMSVYKGVLRHGEVEWSPYIGGSPNPLYGVREFFYPNVILKVQRVLKSGSANVADLTKLGKIDNPNNSAFGFSFSGSGGRSPWLKIEHTYRAEGDEKVETEAWRYGGINGKGGWLRKIYGGSEQW
jgi:hypothetical protein